MRRVGHIIRSSFRALCSQVITTSACEALLDSIFTLGLLFGRSSGLSLFSWGVLIVAGQSSRLDPSALLSFLTFTLGGGQVDFITIDFTVCYGNDSLGLLDLMECIAYLHLFVRSVDWGRVLLHILALVLIRLLILASLSTSHLRSLRTFSLVSIVRVFLLLGMHHRLSYHSVCLLATLYHLAMIRVLVLLRKGKWRILDRFSILLILLFDTPLPLRPGICGTFGLDAPIVSANRRKVFPRSQVVLFPAFIIHLTRCFEVSS